MADPWTGLAIAWIGMLVFDLLIFGMTAYKSWVSGNKLRKSLFKVILRDGVFLTWRIFLSKLNTLPQVHYTLGKRYILFTHTGILTFRRRIMAILELVTVLTFYILPVNTSKFSTFEVSDDPRSLLGLPARLNRNIRHRRSKHHDKQAYAQPSRPRILNAIDSSNFSVGACFQFEMNYGL
ncbi:hypothetical protein C0993_002421 [Termitomyces sp. T159_Od127]|nr:hypothetical protein C0993_002421 [Termitomyces sp. T159_Od127]